MRPFDKNQIATLVARGYLKQKGINSSIANTWTALNPTKSTDNIALSSIRSKSLIDDGGWKGVLTALSFIVSEGNANVFELARITFQDGHINYCFILQGQDLYDGTGEGDTTKLYFAAEITNDGIIAHEILDNDGTYSDKIIPCSEKADDLILLLSSLAYNETNDYIHQEGINTDIGGNLVVDGKLTVHGETQHDEEVTIGDAEEVAHSVLLNVHGDAQVHGELMLDNLSHLQNTDGHELIKLVTKAEFEGEGYVFLTGVVYVVYDANGTCYIKYFTA